MPNAGETKLLAVAGECKDESFIKKVDQFDESYRLVEKNAILNWFDVTERAGYCSLNTPISEIMGTLRGKIFMLSMTKQLMKQMKSKKSSEEKKVGGFELNKDIIQLIGGFSILRISAMSGMVGIEFTKEQLLEFNRKLNKIRVPKK